LKSLLKQTVSDHTDRRKGQVDKQNYLGKIGELKAQGLTTTDACKKVGINPSYYYVLRSKSKARGLPIENKLQETHKDAAFELLKEIIRNKKLSDFTKFAYIKEIFLDD